MVNAIQYYCTPWCVLKPATFSWSAQAIIDSVLTALVAAIVTRTISHSHFSAKPLEHELLKPQFNLCSTNLYYLRLTCT